MTTPYDGDNPIDWWENLAIVENSAVYEFTKAFTKAAMTKYENLDKTGGRGRLFGKLGGELAGLGASVGPSLIATHSKAVQQMTAFGLQSVADYVDKLMQAKTKISIISIINAKSSKSFEETFLLCFIVFALHTYEAYRVSLEYINLEAPGEKTLRENKLQAIVMLAEYAGALCFSALLKSESKKEGEFLRSLGKKKFKKDFKSQWTSATLVNLYYWAQEEGGGKSRKFKKVIITPYDFFVERKLNIFDVEYSDGDHSDTGTVPSGLTSGSKFNVGHGSKKENPWGFWEYKRTEFLGVSTRPALIPVRSILNEEDNETLLDFSWPPIDLDVNVVEKYAKALYDILVRDESFSRDVTGINLVKDLHAKVDEQNSKLDEILEQREDEKYSVFSNRSLRFQIQKPIEIFTGRQDFLTDLHRKLQKCSVEVNRKDTRAGPLAETPPLLVITAPAGIGKTEAVRMYIQKYGHEYNHIIWIDAGNQTAAQVQFKVKLATELRVRTEIRGRPKPFEVIVKDIYMKMCQNRNGNIESILIIFDNAESLSDDIEQRIKGIQDFLPPSFSQDGRPLESTILVTSRNKNWDHLHINTIQLDCWTESDSVNFCLQLLKLPDTAENKIDAADLGHLFGFLPFALQVAVAVILKRQKTSVDKKYGIRDLVDNYNMSGNRTVLKTQPIYYSGNYGQKPTIMSLWNMIFQKILKLKNGDLAIKILCFIVYLSPPYSCLTPKLLSTLLPNVEQNKFAHALNLLQNYFVIEQSNNSLTIHSVVKDSIKEIVKSSSGGNQHHLLSHKTLLNQTELLVKLSTGLAQYLEGKSKLKEIIQEENNYLIDNFFTVTSHFLTDSASMSTKESDEVLMSLNLICRISQSNGFRLDYNKVIDLHKALVKGAEIREGPENHITLTLKNKLADVLMEQGRYTDAKDIYTHVYISQKTQLGRDHAGTMATQACIAHALNCLGNYAGALKMFHAVLLKQRKRQDHDHSNDDPVSLGIKFNVATLLCEQGEYADALTQFECVLKESEEIHGHGFYPNILPLQIQTWMAVVLVKQGKYDEAIDLYMALMDKNEQVRGPHHRETLLLKCDYGTVLSCRGDHKTAQNILQEVFEHQKQTMCYPLLDLAEVENSLANVKVHLDDTGSAIQMYAHVLQVRSAYLGPEHPLTLNTKHAWAHALSLERKFEESTKLLKDVLNGRRKILGEYHADTILTLQYLSEVVFEQGDFEMAARIATDVIELRRRRNPLEAVHLNTVRNQQLLDASIAKLSKGFQDYSNLTKPPLLPLPPLRLPARNFWEVGSVSKSPAPKYCYPKRDQAKEYPDGNRFCCCKPKNWTKLIAAIHIILCGLTLPLNFFKLLISTFCVESYANRDETTLADADHDDDRLMDGNDNGIVNHLQLLLSSPTTTTAVDFICTVAGCILYAGAHYQKPGLILMWLIVEGFTTGVFGIFFIYLMYLISTGTGTEGDKAVAVFVIFLIPLPAISIFCFYIVSRHRRELIEHLIRRREELPSLQFYSENIVQR